VTLLFGVWWISGGFGIWSSKDQLLESQGISKNIVVVEISGTNYIDTALKSQYVYDMIVV